MAAPQAQGGNLDRYVIIHVATTCDEHGVYVTKDSAEVIELGWILLDSKNCDEVCLPMIALTAYPSLCRLTRSLQIVRDSVLVKPINTPITPLCSQYMFFWNVERQNRPLTRLHSELDDIDMGTRPQCRLLP